MATLNTTAAIKNAAASAFNTSIGGSATIKIYAGTIPTNADTAIGAQTLLATLTGNATAFGDVAGAVVTARAIPQQNAVATNTASFFRLATSGGTAICDGDVGTSGATMNLNTLSIVSGGPVSITSATFTQG